MKKIIAFLYALMLGAGASATPDKYLSEKLLRTFRESFPDAHGMNWKENLHSYTVDFLDNQVYARIVYAKNGSFFRSMRFYKVEDLPYYLLVVMRKKYPSRRIFRVVEVADTNGVDYYLKMENGKILTTIRMNSQGKLELIEKQGKNRQ